MLVVRADGFVDPCIPSLAHKPPFGPDWVHEVKHDGYRLIIRRIKIAMASACPAAQDWGRAAIRLALPALARASPA